MICHVPNLFYSSCVPVGNPLNRSYSNGHRVSQADSSASIWLMTSESAATGTINLRASRSGTETTPNLRRYAAALDGPAGYRHTGCK